MADDHIRRGGRRLTATETEFERQKALLVSVARSRRDEPEAMTSLAELALLTETAGSDPVAEELVRRARPDPGTFIGSGKAEELAELATAMDVDVVVFDNELSPAQQGKLKKIFRCDVVDRIAVILDIFAQHAHTKEGMLQVELAQYRYQLPRLRGKGTELSRLGGGIGTRGPGETRLETDRRRILERISKIERELKHLERGRDTRRKARRKAALPVIAIVGYTNAGKSTLFNTLTDASVLVRDQLFATLSSTVRKLELPAGHEALISDTVGFVRRLPHELVEAFRSTLEEVAHSDLLLHVVDGADADPDRQITSVRAVLEEIGASDVPELLVINKTDIAPAPAVRRLLQLNAGAVAVSAVTGDGVDQLGDALVAALERTTSEVELRLPYDRGDLVAAVHRAGDVLKQTHEEEATIIHVRLPSAVVAEFEAFRVE